MGKNPVAFSFFHFSQPDPPAKIPYGVLFLGGGGGEGSGGGGGGHTIFTPRSGGGGGVPNIGG